MLGKRIVALLAQEKRTAQELADFCEVSVQTVYNWLSDDMDPRAKRKPTIAAFFGITMQELEYGDTGAVFSLVELPRRGKKSSQNLTLDQANAAADLLMADTLNRLPPKSIEYMEGMRSRLVLTLSGKTTRTFYRHGTCQLDAFEAGYRHAEKLISIPKKSN